MVEQIADAAMAYLQQHYPEHKKTVITVTYNKYNHQVTYRFKPKPPDEVMLETIEKTAGQFMYEAIHISRND